MRQGAGARRADLDARRELAKRGFGRKLELLDYESAYIEAGKNIGIARDNARKAAATIAALRQSHAQLKQEFVSGTQAALGISIASPNNAPE
jgi:hypothetical protein